MKIEPVQETDRFDNEAFTWSHIVYYVAPGQEKFEDMTTGHLEGQSYATEQEIQECQLRLWKLLKQVASSVILDRLLY